MPSCREYLVGIMQVLEESLKRPFSTEEDGRRKGIVDVFCQMEIDDDDFAFVSAKLREIAKLRKAARYVGPMQENVDKKAKERRKQIACLAASSGSSAGLSKAEGFPSS